MSDVVDGRETVVPSLLLISEEEAKRSIVVSNIPPKTSAEIVHLHFQRKKHGGGEIDRLHISEEGTAVITFEENEVMTTVLQKSHTLEGSSSPLKVHRFVPDHPVEVFQRAEVLINLKKFDLSFEKTCNIPKVLKDKANVECLNMPNSDQHVLSGTFDQIVKALDLLQGILRKETSTTDDWRSGFTVKSPESHLARSHKNPKMISRDCTSSKPSFGRGRGVLAIRLPGKPSGEGEPSQNNEHTRTHSLKDEQHETEMNTEVHQAISRCKQEALFQGNQPTGFMAWRSELRKSLPGYEMFGTIVVTFCFKGGIQGPEHPNPGERYSEYFCTAYLPNDLAGREVCNLLRRAFDGRLIFTIGKCPVTGEDNKILWNGIELKTGRTGGPANCGYPDSSYLDRVKKQLADKGITSVHE